MEKSVDNFEMNNFPVTTCSEFSLVWQIFEKTCFKKYVYDHDFHVVRNERSCLMEKL